MRNAIFPAAFTMDGAPKLSKYPSGTRVGAWVEPGAELDPKTVYTTKSTSDCLYLKPVIPI